MGLKEVVEEIWLLIIPNLPPTPSGVKKSLKLLIVTVNEEKKKNEKNTHTGNKISMTQSRAVWRLGWPGTHPRLTLLPA